MSSTAPFERPAFVPAFADYASFRGQTIGMTGQRGILGGILYGRLNRAGIKIDAYGADINDGRSLADWFAGKQFDRFFHFAAIVPVSRVEENPVLAYRTNVIGAFDVCRHILQAQTGCWFFHASSSHVYRPTAQPVAIAEDAPTDPQTFYGVTKLAAEQVIRPLLEKVKAPYCIGRIFSFSHRGQQEPYLVPSLRRKISELKDGDTLEVGNPSSVRDIQDAETIIDCVLHLARKRATGTINIGTGEGRSVKDVALALARLQNKTIEVVGVDRDSPASLIADTKQLRAILNQ